jgi:hypothetical protein
MGTVWIAVDKADKGNGCLQVRIILDMFKY